MNRFTIYLEAFKRISIKGKAAVIFVSALFFTFVYAIFLPSKPSVPQITHADAKPVMDYKAERLKKAEGHWGEIQEMVKQECAHPLTAEVSLWNASFTALDATAENVLVQGKGSAKNSFGVPDEFHYIVYLAIDLDGRDSIWNFKVYK